MKCMKCGWDYEGSFCPNCGTVNTANQNGADQQGQNGKSQQGQNRSIDQGSDNPFETSGAPYGNPQNAGGPYVNPQNGAPYGNPQNAGGPYVNPQNRGPYGNPQAGGPYVNPQNGAPYGNPQNAGPYRNPQGGNPYGNGAQIGRRVPTRDIAMCIILSIVTCGIYSLYWYYMLNEDTAAVSGEPKFVEGGVLILLTIVTCGIYGIYWCYKIGERMDRARAARGEMTSNLSLLYLILSVFGLSIIAYCLMQSDINKWMEQ